MDIAAIPPTRRQRFERYTFMLDQGPQHDTGLAAERYAEQRPRPQPVHHAGDPKTLPARVEMHLRLAIGTRFDRHREKRRRVEDADIDLVLRIDFDLGPVRRWIVRAHLTRHPKWRNAGPCTRDPPRIRASVAANRKGIKNAF
jgi:hypothetical protein